MALCKPAQVAPLRRAVAGFFQKLALRAGKRTFPGVDLARREFDLRALQRVAKLALEHDLAIGQQRHDHHSARVPQIFARADVTVGRSRTLST